MTHLPSLNITLNCRGRGRRGVELDDFQVGAGQWVLEVGEERLPWSLKASSRPASGPGSLTNAAPVSSKATTTKASVFLRSFMIIGSYPRLALGADDR